MVTMQKCLTGLTWILYPVMSQHKKCDTNGPIDVKPNTKVFKQYNVYTSDYPITILQTFYVASKVNEFKPSLKTV